MFWFFVSKLKSGRPVVADPFVDLVDNLGIRAGRFAARGCDVDAEKLALNHFGERCGDAVGVGLRAFDSVVTGLVADRGGVFRVFHLFFALRVNSLRCEYQITTPF